MKVIRTEVSDAPAWDAFVQAHPDSTSYHQYAWRTVIKQSFGHKAWYLAAVDDQGVWQGILPLIHMKSTLFGNFLVSVPFVNYGGILCPNRQALQPLLDSAEQLRRKCGAGHVELRHIATGLDNLPTRQHKVTMILSLADDVDSQWKAFNPKLRNQIRKAEKSLESVIGGVELLDDFYEVFVRNMRDLGTPVCDKNFFRNVLTSFPSASRIIAVTHNGSTIAAGLVYWYRDTMEIPWASSIADYKALCPNNKLYWQALQFAIEGGFRNFDFGRSTPNEGTFNFKKQWGAQPVPLYWQYLLPEGEALPELNPKNPKYELAIKVWQKLPLGLTKLLGPPIVRNIP